MTKIKDLKPDSKNANRGSEYGQQIIEQSIKEDGFGRSGLLDKNGNVIAGNKTLEASIKVFGDDSDIIIIETDGNKPVYVKRTDLDLSDDNPNNPARRLAYRDNLSSHFSFELDPDIVLADIEAGFDFEAIDIDIGNLGKLLKGETDPIVEWEGMPEFEQEDNFGAVATIKVHFETEMDIANFANLVDQNVNKSTAFVWYPKKKKMELTKYRVIDES